MIIFDIYSKLIMKINNAFLALVIILPSCEFENNEYTSSSAIINQDKNIFLKGIKEGIDKTEGISINLLSYNKVDEINSEAERKTIISTIVSKDNFYFFDYNPSDKTFSDLKIYKSDELVKLNPINKHESAKKLEDALKYNTNFLDKIIKLGYAVYTVNWKVQDKTVSSLAIFNNNEFVYDNLLSNLITFNVEKLPAQKKSTRFNNKPSTTTDIRSASIGGVSISAYYLGGYYNRGTAEINSTANYRVECMPGGTGSSYCKPYMLSIDTNASSYMIWGRSDAQYRLTGGAEGYTAQGKVKYAMYLCTSSVQASITYSNSQFIISESGDFSTMKSAIGEFSYFAEALPLE